jgi:hypothetical protein
MLENVAPPAIAKKMLCRLRLSVRTLGFHPSKRSSILLGDAIHFKNPVSTGFFSFESSTGTEHWYRR